MIWKGVVGTGLIGAIGDEPEALLQESRARLHVLNFASGMDPGAEVPWPESACRSNIVSAFDPGPKLPFQEPGDIMRFPDVLGAGYGKPYLGSGDMLVWPNFVGDFDPGRTHEEIARVRRHLPRECCVPAFAHRDLGWFQARQFSTSAAGDIPSDDCWAPLLPRVQWPECAYFSWMTLSHVLPNCHIVAREFSTQCVVRARCVRPFSLRTS